MKHIWNEKVKSVEFRRMITVLMVYILATCPQFFNSGNYLKFSHNMRMVGKDNFFRVTRPYADINVTFDHKVFSIF